MQYAWRPLILVGVLDGQTLIDKERDHITRLQAAGHCHDISSQDSHHDTSKEALECCHLHSPDELLPFVLKT